jgi:hypothetical protein
MNWSGLFQVLIGAIFGFILKIIHGKLFEKKVALYYEIDKPAVFAVIPPSVCFQNITISNKGNLPAQALKINLNKEIISKYNVMYRSNSEEAYKEESNDKVLTLKFEKILPSEKLTISFKSENPIPDGLIISVKSNEMIARNIATENQPSDTINKLFSMIVVVLSAVVVITTFKVFTLKKSTTQEISTSTGDVIISQERRTPISTKLILDKNVYAAGQTIEAIYRIANISNETLKDLILILDIPGIALDLRTQYQKLPFLKSGDQITIKRKIVIPSDFPKDKHKVILGVSGKGLERDFRDESSAYFEVR